MIELLKRDIGIKAVSILFAVFLWLFVLNTIDNPFERKSLDVNINILNQISLDENKLGLNKQLSQNYVQVEVKGRKDKANSVSISDIEASVDLSQIKDAGIKELPINVSCKKEGVEVVVVKPKSLSLEVENIVQKTIPIVVVQSGKAKENYKITKVTPQPENITIEGIESLIKQAASAKTVIDISNINKSITLKKDYKIYGKSNDEIAELSKNGSVEVTVEVAKEVSVIPIIKGKPAKDYVINGYSTNKDRVLISGFPEQLDNIYELNTEPVSIENISKNSDILSFIKLPENVKLVDNQKDITVSVKVEQLLKKEFEIKKENILLQNKDETKFVYELVPDILKFSIKGRDKDVKNIELSNIKVSVDLTGVSEGNSKLPLKIVLPSSEVSIAEDYYIEVKVSKKS